MSNWVLLGRLGLALALSSAIGLEREFRRKAAGLRTITLVGVGAALAMIVSKYGFGDMHGADMSLDPSRVAAQIVSGIGFLGAGIIFVRRDTVAGLTTAAIVWLTAMIGMAAGAGMLVIAVGATAAHFVIALAYPVAIRHLPRSPWTPNELHVTYVDRHGVLRDVLSELTARCSSVSRLAVDRTVAGPGQVAVALEVVGKPPTDELAALLSHLDGVLSVDTGESEEA